jgi:hypothetical protein
MLYGHEIGLSEYEAEKFYDHFQSNGWKTSRGPMKDWRAAERNWSKRSGEFKALLGGKGVGSQKISSGAPASEALRMTSDELKAAGIL